MRVCVVYVCVVVYEGEGKIEGEGVRIVDWVMGQESRVREGDPTGSCAVLVWCRSDWTSAPIQMQSEMSCVSNVNEKF